MEKYRGFYKVEQNGFSLTAATFWNPQTDESFSKIVWDMDNDRLLWDEEIQYLRNMSIDKDILRLWNRRNGIIQPEDTVKVVKGRKVPIGTVARVLTIKPYYDKYRRWQADYTYLDNGTKTNINNLVLVI